MILLLSVNQCRRKIYNALRGGTVPDEEEYAFDFNDLSEGSRRLIDSLVELVIELSENTFENDELKPTCVELPEDAYQQRAAYRGRFFFQGRQIAVDNLLFDLFLGVAQAVASGVFADTLEGVFSGEPDALPAIATEISGMILVGMRGFLKRPKFEGFEHCVMIKSLATGHKTGFTIDDVGRWMPARGAKCDIPIRRGWGCSLRTDQGLCEFFPRGFDCLNDTLSNMVEDHHFVLTDNQYRVTD